MIDLHVYNTQAETFVEKPSVERLSEYLNTEGYWLWLDLTHPTSQEVAILSDQFQFDPLALEDCQHPRQSPKLESFRDYHFFIVHSMVQHPDSKDYVQQELDGFLGDRFLVTFHEDLIVAVDAAKRKIQYNHSRFSQGVTFLAYEILDQMIDMYMPVLDYFDDKIRTLEKVLENEPYSHHSAQCYKALSSQILDLRRIALKNQQVFYQFSHSPLKFIDSDEARLFRDIYDHMVRVVDMSEYYLQALRSALDIQFSMNTGRVNQVVQYLTLIATILLPLNVVTGLYGMNFESMPLLHSPYGFWVVLSAMAIIATVMLLRFRRRGWL